MQETRHQHEYSYLATPVDTASSQGGTAIYLSLSASLAGAVAVGLFAELSQQHVQPLPALLVVLAAAAICGFLCTVPLQYSLYLLELTLSRLAHAPFHATREESVDPPSFTRRFPLGPLFQATQEIEQRVRRYRTHARLTAEVREHALQQAREAAALAERNRIARDLHDSIKQQIFGINASAAAARAYWQRENMEGAREAVGDIERSAEEAQVEMQALLQQLRPAPLENTSLLEALHTQAQALGFRTGARVEVDLAALPEPDRFVPGTQEAIFRLVQEAFANIVRHARARAVWLTLGIAGQALHITVRDDGQGFDPAQVRSGMGLCNLRERTRALQGHLEVRSRLGQGTTVLITIPLVEALRNPEEEERSRYELARALELARRGYQFCAKTSLLGVVLGLVGILTLVNPLFGLAVVASLLVAIAGYARGVYYRASVEARAGRDHPAVLELVPLHYRTGLSLLFLAILDLLYFIKLASSLGVTAGRWLMLAIPLCLFGLILVSLWWYARSTARSFHLLSTQELDKELAKRKQALARASITLGIVSASDVFINHALFVFPPVTPAQQNSSTMVLTLLVGGGMVIMWNYRSVQRLKQQLGQRTLDQVQPRAQEERDDG